MNQSKTIKIELNKEYAYSSKLINIYNDNDFTHDSFKIARDLLEEIFDATMLHNKNKINPIYPNNIIAFCADRGQGKTSAMNSFCDSLKCKKDPNTMFAESIIKKEDAEKFWGDKLYNTNFTVLPPIDPTTMENNDSILKIIISRIFSYFQNNNANSNRNFNDEEKIIKKLRRCYENLHYLMENSKPDDFNDDIEELSDLGDSSNFRKHLHELIEEFLNIIHSNQDTNKNFLVIQIDDADMNIEKAYEITEHLRKYCFLPNVVIVMAVNINQLEQTVEQYFLNTFKVLSSHYKDRVQEDCHSMSIKYIEKLFPGKYKISLPLIENVLLDKSINLKINYHKNNDIGDNSEDYHKFLINLIRRKTGILLIKSEYREHELFPNTLRGLSHFIDFLSNLEDVQMIQDVIFDEKGNENETIEENFSKLIINLNLFLKYFKNDWCRLNLSNKQTKIIENIDLVPYSNKINRILLEIRDYFNDECDLENTENTLSEVRYVLWKLSELKKSEMDKKFLYAINFYITIISNILLVDYVINIHLNNINMEMEDINETLLHQNVDKKQQVDEHPFNEILTPRQFPWEALGYNSNNKNCLGGHKFKISKLLKNKQVIKNMSQSGFIKIFSIFLKYESENKYKISKYKNCLNLDDENELINYFNIIQGSELYLDIMKSNLRLEKNFILILLININWDLQRVLIESLNLKQEELVLEKNWLSIKNQILDLNDILNSIMSKSLGLEENEMSDKINIVNDEIILVMENLYLLNEDYKDLLCLEFCIELISKIDYFLKDIDLDKSGLNYENMLEELLVFSTSIIANFNNSYASSSSLENIPDLSNILSKLNEICLIYNKLNEEISKKSTTKTKRKSLLAEYFSDIIPMIKDLINSLEVIQNVKDEK